jgi:hypothetical protein
MLILNKKTIIFVLLITTIWGCKSQKTDTELIDDFVKEIILNKNSTPTEFEKYFNYSSIKEVKKKSVLILFIKENIKFLRKELGDKKYLIVSNNEFVKKNINFIYNLQDSQKVYHLVLNDNAVTTFILKDKKIISFFYNIVKGNTNRRTPFIIE